MPDLARAYPTPPVVDPNDLASVLTGLSFWLDAPVDVLTAIARGEQDSELIVWTGYGAVEYVVDREPPRKPLPQRIERAKPLAKPPVYTLYRLLDANERVLYIGITKNITARLRAHHRKWGTVIASTRLEEYDDPESLLEAEAAAIHDEQPPFNSAGVG